MEKYRRISESEILNILVSLSEMVPRKTTFDYFIPAVQVHLIVYKDKNGILWWSSKPKKGKYTQYQRIPCVSSSGYEVLDFENPREAVETLVKCAASFPGEIKINSLSNIGYRLYIYNKSNMISWNVISKEGRRSPRKIVLIRPQ